MTTGGVGIPRLQELSYLEVVIRGVANGATFEDLRRSLVEHMIAIGEASPGTGNVAITRNATTNPKRYVHNVAEALKEHMRLGFIEKAILPSSAASAYAYRLSTFALTREGQRWVNQLTSDRPGAYNVLAGLLLRHHPQFGGFLQAVGAMSTSANEAFVVPLLRWADLPKPRTRDSYIDQLASWAARGVAEADLGWVATSAEIADTVREHTRNLVIRAEGHERGDPFARNRDFTNACEEALVKLAFSKAGLQLDYISMEILRRWTRTLGLVNFSYWAPGPSALRFWPVASVTWDGEGLQIERRAGSIVRERIVEYLRDAYAEARRNEPTGSAWVPIYRVRAAACWTLKVMDSEFDAAILELLRGDRGHHLPYGVNLDQAAYGNIPPSERALVVTAAGGNRVFRSLSLVPRTASTAGRK